MVDVDSVALALQEALELAEMAPPVVLDPHRVDVWVAFEVLADGLDLAHQGIA